MNDEDVYSELGFRIEEIELYFSKQVHSLCVDSRPDDRLRLAKGHPSIIPHSVNVFGDGREKNARRVHIYSVIIPSRLADKFTKRKM